ncbi:MAG: response regulator transcription factor [Proteobacteria bacterium]|nr:response regulator transcription factor [Pseudomonadota bacterium]
MTRRHHLAASIAQSKRRGSVLPSSSRPTETGLQPKSAVSNRLEATPGSVRILAVDDDPVAIQVLDNYLSPKGFSIEKAFSGEEAFEAIRKNGKPDLILLDVVMPGMSGFEFCRQLRKNYSLDMLPVVFLSVRNRISDIVEGFDAGANDYIVKPFDKDELLARVQNALFMYKTVEKLVSLRDLRLQIGKVRTHNHMLSTALKLLYENIMSCQTALFHEDKLVKSYPETHLDPSIQHSLSPERKESLFRDSGLEIASETRESGDKDQILVYVKIKEFEDYLISCLIDSANPLARKIDIEYIKNMVKELKSIRNSPPDIVTDPKILESITLIKRKLDDILYVKSEPPYCGVVCDSPDSDPILLRASIQNLELFFSDSELIRVHRSYLINPHKLVSVDKKGVRDYVIRLRHHTGQTASIPVSRSYQAILKRLPISGTEDPLQ